MSQLNVIANHHAAVSCPHLYKGVCCAATDATGIIVRVTPPVCNVTCTKYHGPNGGGPIPDDDGTWAHAMLRHAWGISLRKVADRYTKPFDVQVPDEWIPRIRAVLAPLTSRAWYAGIGLTGSVLSPRGPHKDIDAVLIVNDLRAYLDDIDELPTEVDGIRLDVMQTTRREQWFLLLDLDDLTLYRSGAYNLVSVDPRITVKDVVNRFAAFRQRGPAQKVTTVPAEPSSEIKHHDLTLLSLQRQPWPRRGRLLWQWMRSLRTPTMADITAVTPMISDGGCDCRRHWSAALDLDPPPFDLWGFRKWLYRRQQDVNKKIGFTGIPWEEAERRYALADKIAGVYVISLARTPERLDAFWEHWPADWPLQLPTVIEAVDGTTAPAPPGWFDGVNDPSTNLPVAKFVRDGANGCRLSHLKAIALGSTDPLKRPWITFEDDARPRGGDSIGPFMSSLPDDYDMAFLGCQHVESRPIPVNERVARCVRCERTHALMINPRYGAELTKQWTECKAHIDWRLGQIGREQKFYAAAPQIVAQGENFSTIVNGKEEHRSWSAMHVPHYDAKRPATAWDRAVVINLKTRPDRMIVFNETIRKSKLLAATKWHRFEALTPEDVMTPSWWAKWKPAHFACRASHLAVWAQAIKDKVQNLLVVEDDIKIFDNFDARIGRFAEAVDKGLSGHWWGYQLGGFTWSGHGSFLIPSAPGIMQMGGIGGLHFYCLNAMGIQRAYDHVMWHNTLSLDEATARLYREEPHFFMPKDFFVAQLAGFSDNEGREVDYGSEYEPIGGYEAA